MNKITLFDKDMNYLTQNTPSIIAKKYGVDERNINRAIKNDSLTKGVSTQAIVIDLYLLSDFTSRKQLFKQNGIKIHKIGNYYISTESIEIRSPMEKDMPFMDDTSMCNVIMYVKNDSLTNKVKNDSLTNKRLEIDFQEEKNKYIAKYKTMTLGEHRREANYNYYENPRINDIKAKASFAASYEVEHGKPLPWFPVREKDIQKILNSIS